MELLSSLSQTNKMIQGYQTYYNELFLPDQDNERNILCLLLDKTPAQFNSGSSQLAKTVSSHIGERDLKRLLPIIWPHLISNAAFTIDQDFLRPKDALEMIESIIYLQILHEEFKNKSGRRGFFISNFKEVKPDWVYFSFEFLFAKTTGKSPRDLLALFIGTKQYNLEIFSKINEAEKIKTFIEMTRARMVGIFQDSAFLGFKSYKKINDIESIQQNLFEEITLLNEYFNKKGGYFELYGEIKGILTLPPEPIRKLSSPAPAKKIELTPLQKSLVALSLKEMPASKQELKKIFFKLAAATHPDKFEHVDKGTKTEIAIVDKFREIYSAYEFVEKELEKQK